MIPTPWLRRLPFAVFSLLALAPAPRALAQRERLPFEDVEVVEKRWPNLKRTGTSLRYMVLKEGDTKGPSPVPGNIVKALYKGMLLNGKVFDEVNDPKAPLTMRLGRNLLIPGWEEALQKMHRGDRWLLVVPFELGYGSRGRPPDIPPRATLVFEVELLDFTAG